VPSSQRGVLGLPVMSTATGNIEAGELVKKFKIINGGHADLPKELTERWGTHFVALEDHHDYVILRPAPDEASVPRELEEPWAEEQFPPSLRRGSTGAGY
jgi:hypothetical protein